LSSFENDTLPVPISVQGRRDIPYVLMSLPLEKPNLHAVDVMTAYNVTRIFCFHYNETTSQETNIETGTKRKKNVHKNHQSNVESSLAMFENDFNAFT
jgi:hypothetical protein